MESTLLMVMSSLLIVVFIASFVLVLCIRIIIRHSLLGMAMDAIWIPHDDNVTESVSDEDEYNNDKDEHEKTEQYEKDDDDDGGGDLDNEKIDGDEDANERQENYKESQTIELRLFQTPKKVETKHTI